MAISAVVGLAAGATAVAVGAAAFTAVAVGVVAAATFDYMMDSMVADEVVIDTMSGRKVTKAETIGVRKVIVGTLRVGGNIVYQAVSGENNRYLHYIVAFSGDEADYLEKLYLDDELAYERNSKASAGGYRGQYSTNEDGSLSQNGKSLTVVPKDGEYDQEAVQGYDLPDEWTTDHKLRGICYAYIRFDQAHNRFKDGVPKITATVRGVPQYDPTGDPNHAIYDGNGSRNTHARITWDYSENSALILYNYMKNDWYGLNVPDSHFDYDSLEDAINICNENVSITGGTQKRYTCNGIIDTKQSVKSNIRNILASMNGKLMYANGKYHIKPYAYETPHSQVINDGILAGNIEFNAKTNRKSLFNAVKGKFVNAEDDYELTEYPVQLSTIDANTGNPIYQDQDGERLDLDFDQPMVTNHTRAQRLARLKLLRSRMMTTVKGTMNAKGLVYKVGDFVKITNSAFGITEQEFELTSLTINVDKEKGITVGFEARETAQGIFNWQASDAEDFTSGTTVDLPTTSNIAPVANLVALPYSSGIPQKPGAAMRLIWDAPTAVNIKRYQIGYYKTGDTYNTEFIYTDNTEHIIYGLDTDTSYVFFVRVFNLSDVRSDGVSVTTTTLESFSPSGGREYIIEGDPDVQPTDEQFADALGRDPLRNDILTVIEVVNGVTVGSSTWVYAPYLQGSDWAEDGWINTPQGVPYNSGQTARSAMIWLLPKSLTDAENVTWSYSLGDYESNDGSTSPHTLTFETVDTVEAKGYLVKMEMPSSHYSTITPSTESDYSDYVYQMIEFTISATWDNQTVSKTHSMHVNAYGVTA